MEFGFRPHLGIINLTARIKDPETETYDNRVSVPIGGLFNLTESYA